MKKNIDIKKVNEFQKEIEEIYKKFQVEPSFQLGNDYSLAFVFDKYICNQEKNNFKILLNKWFNFFSFILVTNPDISFNTKKLLLSLYSSVENSFLLANFLRLSGSNAIIRGVYENLLKVLYELSLDENYDIRTKEPQSIKIRNLHNNIKADPKFTNEELVKFIFDTYGELCKHSHNNIIQVEQIVQENYLEALLNKIDDYIKFHNQVVNLSIAYYLVLFPDTLYNKNNLTFATTDLVRRNQQNIFWGTNFRFFYYSNLPKKVLNDLIPILSLNPSSDNQKFLLAEIYIMVELYEEGSQLLKFVIETNMYSIDANCQLLLLLVSKKLNNEIAYNKAKNILIERNMVYEAMQSYYEEFMGNLSSEVSEILIDLEVLKKKNSN